MLSKQEQADNAKIDNLSLNDQIKFSTINVSIYQRQGVKKNIIFNESNTNKYEIGFGYKLLEGFAYGWRLLKIVLLFVSKLWGLALFGMLLYFGIKWYTKKN